jgi:hypothetical protein
LSVPPESGMDLQTQWHQIWKTPAE